MPDDRESNFAGVGYQGAYPTMKRYNLGIRFIYNTKRNEKDT